MSLFEILMYSTVAVLVLAYIVPSGKDTYEYLWQK